MDLAHFFQSHVCFVQIQLLASGGVIAVNALLMGCETDIDWGGWLVFENFLLCSLAWEKGTLLG